MSHVSQTKEAPANPVTLVTDVTVNSTRSTDVNGKSNRIIVALPAGPVAGGTARQPDGFVEPVIPIPIEVGDEGGW